MAGQLKRLLYRAARPLIQAAHRQSRGMTLGTRTLALAAEDREVLLVRHTYTAGWVLPGGGVERGEAMADAAIRELREEAGIIAEENPVLHGLFSNEPRFPGDHVACYVLRRFRREAFSPNAEIAEARFFAVNQLPDDVTGGTERRIREILEGLPPARLW